MALEIERKFLVDTSRWKPVDQGKKLIQAYLSKEPNPTVRIRIAEEQAFLTIKGRTESITRAEFEYEIPVDEAQELLKMAITNPVEKIRYEVMHEDFCWEVDVFSGKNSGLVMAEIELDSEDQEFSKPDWILSEVSSDRRYYNSQLSEQPFSEW